MKAVELILQSDLFNRFVENEQMRVKVYELQPGPHGFVVDEDRLYCVIEINEGKGNFRFFDTRREELIRSLFEAPSSRFVAGGRGQDGVHFDAMETHPAWTVAAIEAIVGDELYGHNLGGVIEYDKSA
jgi:hypothetical protein